MVDRRMNVSTLSSVTNMVDNCVSDHMMKSDVQVRTELDVEVLLFLVQSLALAFPESSSRLPTSKAHQNAPFHEK